METIALYSSSEPRRFSAEQEQLLLALESGHKLQAIKLYKYLLGVGSSVAKKEVELWLSRARSPHPEQFLEDFWSLMQESNFHLVRRFGGESALARWTT